MIKPENSVLIKRPVAEVFEYLANGENNPQWQSSAQEVKKTSDGPIGVGTKFANMGCLLGRPLETTLECTEYEPNLKLVIKVVSGPMPFKVETAFDPIAEGVTKVTFIGEADVGDFFKLLPEPIVARRIQRQFETDHTKLKDLLEAQG